MEIVKIELENPITDNEVKKMISKIKEITSPKLLLIDFGNHDFESLNALKYCKTELHTVETHLLGFKKIAFVTAPPYTNVDSKNLRFFNSLLDAKEWLLNN